MALTRKPIIREPLTTESKDEQNAWNFTKIVSTEETPRKLSEFDMKHIMEISGSLDITEEQEKILFDNVPENEILIRTDGLIYLPWAFYSKRLSNAFKMKWSLIPDGGPEVREELIIWGFYLVIKGIPVSYSIGEQEFTENNKRMNYAQCAEGAKSNAIMRCCKGIGMALELWDQDFISKWKNKYAVSSFKDGRSVWRKKVVD